VTGVHVRRCCRLGIGEHHQQRNADEELNEYLSQAISGRNIDRLKAQHMNQLSLTFRSAHMETRVTSRQPDN